MIKENTQEAKKELQGFDEKIKQMVQEETEKITKQFSDTVNALMDQLSKPITLSYTEQEEEEPDEKQNRVNNLLKYVK